MANPRLINFGYAVIQEDLKRLKKIESLTKDLDTAFNITNEAWIEHGVCIDANRHIYSDGEIHCYKKRIPITSTNTSPAHGLRLIYALVKKIHFVPLLLFSAKEEGFYTLKTNKNIIKNRIKEHKVSGSIP